MRKVNLILRVSVKEKIEYSLTVVEFATTKRYATAKALADDLLACEGPLEGDAKSVINLLAHSNEVQCQLVASDECLERLKRSA